MKRVRVANNDGCGTLIVRLRHIPVEHIEVSLGYTDMFRQFQKDQDLGALVAGYWRQYVDSRPSTDRPLSHC